jgi:hypothetical protein
MVRGQNHQVTNDGITQKKIKQKQQGHRYEQVHDLTITRGSIPRSIDVIPSSSPEDDATRHAAEQAQPPHDMIAPLEGLVPLSRGPNFPPDFDDNITQCA